MCDKLQRKNLVNVCVFNDQRDSCRRILMSFFFLIHESWNTVITNYITDLKGTKLIV